MRRHDSGLAMGAVSVRGGTWMKRGDGKERQRRLLKRKRGGKVPWQLHTGLISEKDWGNTVSLVSPGFKAGGGE